MALSPGTRLGPYQILSPLGAGGMGEVYRATDTTLGRDVAIKTLPDGFARDPARLARFKREAQILAALNHPHIAAVYGLEEVSGGRFLVLELVEGDTLAQRIATGPVSVTEALRLARQVADALQTAHEKGIIHRDLKPANIALTHEGQVKVLDFGLARVIEPDPLADTSDSPTFSRAATQAGVIMGTAAYMSPEQAKGRVADKRSDIWAFGAVLYEMLTGKRAFEGEDVSEILATVLKSDPDWTALPADVAASIRTLVMRCLEKDRTRRVGDIAAALFVIDEQNGLRPSGTIAALPLGMPPLWRRAVTATAAVVVGAAVASGAWWSVRPSTPPRTVTRFTVALAAGQQFTNLGRQVLAISPDGTRVVYAANRRLYLRPMSETEARPIVGTENETGVAHPVFSPDGQSVAFYSGADRMLKRIAVRGGAAVTICEADSPFGMSWGPDGIVFGQGPKGIMRVSPGGGKPDLLVSVNPGEFAHGPQILSDGQAVLFTLSSRDMTNRWDNAHIVVQSLKSGERKTLIDGGSDGRYLPTGHLVYAIGGTLFAVPLDVRRLEVTGLPTPVVEGVRRADNATGTAHFSSSNSGSLIFAPGPARVSRSLRVFVVADRTGTTHPLNLAPGAYTHPRVSPDGTRLAFGTDDDKEANVWIYELSGAGAPRRITFRGKNRFPVWSGDGQRVAFQSDREGDLGIFWQRADGAGEAQRLTKGEQGASHVPESWSRDGKHLLFTITQDSRFTLWTFALDERKATPFGDVRSRQPIAAVFSPDGRWVAYDLASEGNTRTAGGVLVQPFPATGARYQIPRLDFDYHPLWSADGKDLFYIPAAGRFAAVSVQMQPNFAFGNPVEAQAIAFTRGIRFGDVRNYDVTPAGKFVALVDPRAPGASGTSAAPEIQVVLNWFEELKQHVPTK
jgi:eukaryotic-like serine/threonine-protein kinase